MSPGFGDIVSCVFTPVLGNLCICQKSENAHGWGGKPMVRLRDIRALLPMSERFVPRQGLQRRRDPILRAERLFDPAPEMPIGSASARNPTKIESRSALSES